MSLDPAQYYTGLAAQLYEPLLSHRARADDYLPFLTRCGAPALELACGSGLPLLDLRARGLDIEGLDSSADMLELCRMQARARGLELTLHRATMQDFNLARRYRAIFLAGASFSLLTTDTDARAALSCMRRHLEPAGRVMIPVETEPGDLGAPELLRVREARDADGSTLRFQLLHAERTSERVVRYRASYLRVRKDGSADALERDWLRSFYSEREFEQMLSEAGFERIRSRVIGKSMLVFTASV